MTLHEKILAEIEKTQAKLSRAGLASFHIPFEIIEKFDKIGTIAKALYSGKLQFSHQYFQYPEDIPFAQLVAHEVAHLYQYKYYPGGQGHGREFRKIMKYLGFSGNAKVAVTGQAATVAKERVAQLMATQPARKPKTKTRFVYITKNTNREVFLTAAQHKKQQQWLEVNGGSRFVSKGEPLVDTGKVRKFV